MQINKMKNIVVLKGMDSNVVEEAIVVLKPNIKLKQREHIRNNSYTIKEKNKRKTIVKEAECVIENYIKKIQLENEEGKEKIIEKKYKNTKIINFFLIGILIICSFIII